MSKKKELQLMEKGLQVRFISERLQVTLKEAEQIYDVCLVNLPLEAITNFDGLSVPKRFSIFKTEQAARHGKNPRTQEPVFTPAKIRVKAQVSPSMEKHVQ